MFEFEVYVPDRVPLSKLLKTKPRTLEEGREAETVYDKKLIRMNLTGIWLLAFEDYGSFLDELTGIILHEYLHYFFHVNQILQNEELIESLSRTMFILSLRHLIGATDNDHESAKKYEEAVEKLFKEGIRLSSS